MVSCDQNWLETVCPYILGVTAYVAQVTRNSQGLGEPTDVVDGEDHMVAVEAGSLVIAGRPSCMIPSFSEYC